MNRFFLFSFFFFFFFFCHCFDSRVKSRVSHLENFGLNFSSTSLVIILRNIPKLGNDRQALLQIVDSYNLSILRNRLLTPVKHIVRSQLGYNVFPMQSY